MKPICPVAQKTQPIAHPAWVLMQAVTRPVKRINTVSIVRASGSVRRNFRVKPSLESVARAVGRTPSCISASKRRRTFIGSSTIAPRSSASSQYR